MGKYYKLVWSGNITRNILRDFRDDVEKELQDKQINIGHWQSRHGDFNGDGKQDVLLSYFDNHWDVSNFKADQNANGQLVLLLGNGAKGFKDGTSLLPQNGRLDGMSMQPTIADFNDDGIDDIILNNHNEDGRLNADDWPSDQYAYLSTPNGFKQVDLDLNTWGRSSVSGDFNNDGRLDFAVFGWTEINNNVSYNYLQNAEGGFDKTPTGYVGGNVFVSGDFDGDGELEFASFGGFWKGDGAFINRLWEINDDGSIGEVQETRQKPYEVTSEGRAISKRDGVEYLDDGLHFADTGDVNGDGADDVVAIRYAYTFDTKNGEYVNLKDYSSISIYSGADGEGMKETYAKIRGWTAPDSVISDIFLVDWNGDGHLDIFVNWGDKNKGLTEAERVFLNDGTGDFTRLAQKYLPSGINRDSGMLEYGNYTDANKDGIMDVLVRPGEVYSDSWGKFSEGLYLGTKRIVGVTDKNPATEGAPGFNAEYYRSEMTDHLLKTNGHLTALEHYLQIGKDNGLFAFAPGTHVYGFDGKDSIILREGNEHADGMGGDDVLVGAGGADTLTGGQGSDRFVYLSVADSGTTAETRDIIKDFRHGVDVISLKDIDAVSGTAGDDTFSLLPTEGSAFTGAAGQLRWREGSTGVLILESDVDGDSIADFQIEVRGAAALSAADFAL